MLQCITSMASKHEKTRIDNKSEFSMLFPIWVHPTVFILKESCEKSTHPCLGLCAKFGFSRREMCQAFWESCSKDSKQWQQKWVEMTKLAVSKHMNNNQDHFQDCLKVQSMMLKPWPMNQSSNWDQKVNDKNEKKWWQSKSGEQQLSPQGKFHLQKGSARSPNLKWLLPETFSLVWHPIASFVHLFKTENLSCCEFRSCLSKNCLNVLRIMSSKREKNSI